MKVKEWKNCRKRWTSGEWCLASSSSVLIGSRSKFQYLENELAELDAQLKAAEERLARAQEAGIVAPGELSSGK